MIGITEFEPIDYQDEKGNWIGFDADMATAFAESLGVKPVFQIINWDNKAMELDGKNVKVYRTAIGSETTLAAGKIAEAGKQGLAIACGDRRLLRILELQAEGGKRMAAADYLRGHPVQVDV